MALTPEQERLYIVELARMGETRVRSDLDRAKISAAYIHLATQWLSDKERETGRLREASQSEQMELMRRDSAASERQAIATERANTRANFALCIAIISIIVSVIGIWVAH